VSSEVDPQNIPVIEVSSGRRCRSLDDVPFLAAARDSKTPVTDYLERDCFLDSWDHRHGQIRGAAAAE
jgi:hypothetical protein